MSSGGNELSKFSDSPGDASLEDLFHPLENSEDRVAEASTSASSSNATQGNVVSDGRKNDLAIKLRATIAKKQMEHESVQASGDLLRLMMGVLKEDVIDIDTLVILTTEIGIHYLIEFLLVFYLMLNMLVRDLKINCLQKIFFIFRYIYSLPGLISLCTLCIFFPKFFFFSKLYVNIVL